MASKSGQAGASTRDLAEKRSLIRAGFGLMAAVVGLIFLTVLPHAKAAGFAMVAVLFVAFKIAMNFLESKIDTKIVEEKRAIRGAVAEEKVEEILDQLGDDHLILHDVRCQFGNIDHIVLSKAHGVFLIETKAHGGRVATVESKIRINGKLPEKDFIAQTLRNTYWLVEELEATTGVRPWVTSLIVFTNAFVVRGKPIKGITVTNKKFLLETMKQLGQPLAPQVWEARQKIAALFTSAK
jgi:Holliday junction resolvase-like predicted endonuclease